MKPPSFKRHRLPPAVSRQGGTMVFPVHAQHPRRRGIDGRAAGRGQPGKAIRCWKIKFGPPIATNLRKGRPSPTGRWHLDDAVMEIGERRMHLGEPSTTKARFSTPLSRAPKQACGAESAASSRSHQPVGRQNNIRAENSRLVIRRRERKQQGFKSQVSAQRLLTIHAAIYNTFNLRRRLISRPNPGRLRADADAAWAAAAA